eukprot:5682455-Pleurochrysis_carterae.AAC.1
MKHEARYYEYGQCCLAYRGDPRDLHPSIGQHPLLPRRHLGAAKSDAETAALAVASADRRRTHARTVQDGEHCRHAQNR